MKVLVVEGDKVGRQAIVEALARVARVAVTDAVPDLTSAIQAMSRVPDIVVTEVAFADGLIAAARQADHAPSIVVVGHDASRAEWRRHLEAGADRFVERDRELRELRDVVGQLAARQPIDPLRLLGRLAAGITHDFNNYLTVIGASLALYQRKPDDRLIADARAAVDAASRLTARLSSYARGEVVPAELVDLGALVTNTLAIVRSTLPSSVQVTTEVHEHLVRGVVPELEQMVLNLLLNAADAMAKGGELTISVRGPILEIAHSGGPAPTKLGLDIVRQVCERHRARLRVSPGSIQVAFPLPG